MEHLISLVWNTSQEYRDIIWAGVVAGLLIYYKNKSMCNIAKNKTCLSHDTMIKSMGSLETKIIHNKNLQRWVIAHLYKLCIKNDIPTTPEPIEE